MNVTDTEGWSDRLLSEGEKWKEDLRSQRGSITVAKWGSLGMLVRAGADSQERIPGMSSVQIGDFIKA